MLPCPSVPDKKPALHLRLVAPSNTRKTILGPGEASSDAGVLDCARGSERGGLASRKARVA